MQKFQNKHCTGLSFLKMFLKRKCNFFCQNFQTLYTGAMAPKSEIKNFLMQYKSGSVRLQKQENGVAHIILDNPDRRNAISGTIVILLLSILLICHFYILLT